MPKTEMPTPSSSGITSMYCKDVCPCKWRHGVSPICVEANPANALLVYSECLETGTQKSSYFVQISGHFS